MWELETQEEEWPLEVRKRVAEIRSRINENNPLDVRGMKQLVEGIWSLEVDLDTLPHNYGPVTLLIRWREEDGAKGKAKLAGVLSLEEEIHDVMRVDGEDYRIRTVYYALDKEPISRLMNGLPLKWIKWRDKDGRFHRKSLQHTIRYTLKRR